MLFLFICKHESADCVTNCHKIHERIIPFSYWWVIKSLKCKLKPKQNLITLIMLLENDSFYTQTLKSVPVLSSCAGISLGLRNPTQAEPYLVPGVALCCLWGRGSNKGCSWLQWFYLALCIQGVIYSLDLIVNVTFSSQLSLTLHWPTPGDDFRDFPGGQD